jgi:hypothetical protein
VTSRCKFNHTSVTSQDTSDRLFNRGFDFVRPTKYKGNYLNEQPFSIRLRQATSCSSNVSGLISTIYVHRMCFNINRI